MHNVAFTVCHFYLQGVDGASQGGENKEEENVLALRSLRREQIQKHHPQNCPECVLHEAGGWTADGKYCRCCNVPRKQLLHLQAIPGSSSSSNVQVSQRVQGNQQGWLNRPTGTELRLACTYPASPLERFQVVGLEDSAALRPCKPAISCNPDGLFKGRTRRRSLVGTEFF